MGATEVGARARRCLTVWVAATGGVTPLLWSLGTDVVRASAAGRGSSSFETVLVTGCASAAMLSLGWLWVLVSLLTLDAALGRRRRRPGVPRLLRRAVLAACGLGVMSSLSLPASAGSSPPPSPLTGLAVPDRTTDTRWVGHLATGDPPARPLAADRFVVVAAGDSLWSLAVAHLPNGAATAAVDAHWRAIHAANRAAIGADPDLIRPGLRLQLPPVPAPGSPA